MNTLTATKRSKTEKLVDIRSNGMVPAVVYGAQVENTPISVSSVDFLKLFKVAGETSTIVLELEDTESKTKKNLNVLIHDLQVHPVKGFPLHIDFLAIDMNKKINVSVPLEYIGVAPADKDGLGILNKVIHEIEIEALPKDMPNSIEVDLSSLINLDDQIRARDITLSDGVELVTDADKIIALIASIKEVIEEVVEEEVDLSSIEVEKKGKKEDEGEEKESKEPESKAEEK